MSSYKNWQSVVEEFERSEDFRRMSVPEQYSRNFMDWLFGSHYPPLGRKSDFVMGGLRIDMMMRKVTLPNGSLHFPPKKIFDLLVFLASNPNRIMNRDEILSAVWGSNVCVLDRTIDVHVNKIRGILGRDSVLTVKGVGYRFNREASYLFGKEV
jgi:DNA-binding response OmpR family regulator